MDQILPGTCFFFFFFKQPIKQFFFFFFNIFKWLPFKWLHSSLTFCLLSVWHLKYLLYGSLWKSLLTPVLRHLLYVTYWFLSYVSRKVLDKVIFEICEKNATQIIFCVLRFTWGILTEKGKNQSRWPCIQLAGIAKQSYKQKEGKIREIFHIKASELKGNSGV